jgi:hypothetical protein
MKREPGPWVALGYKNRAEYRAAMRAAGQRHYPLESERRRQREGKGYGHGRKRAVNDFLKQLKGRDTVVIIFHGLVVKGWQYKKGKGWLLNEKNEQSEVPVVIDAQYAYQQLQNATSLKEIVAELLNGRYGLELTEEDILELDEDDIEIEDI